MVSRARTVAIIVEVFMLACVITHEVMKIKDGYFELDKGYRPEDKVLLSTFGEVFQNPALLKDPKNHNFIPFVTRLVSVYLAPAVCAIAVTFAASQIEESLIPLSRLYDASPFTVQAHLSQSIL